MFCPVCGGFTINEINRCVYCGKTMYSRNIFSNEIEKNSLPLFNPFKAIYLRVQYNKIPENKKKGIENIKKDKDFRKEIKKTHEKIKFGLKKVADLRKSKPKRMIRVSESEIKGFFNK